MEIPSHRIVPSKRYPDVVLTDPKGGQTYLETVLLDRGIDWNSIETVKNIILYENIFSLLLVKI